MSATRDELYTVIENLTGGDRVFGFLGSKGMRLSAGEVVTVPGDILGSLAAQVNSGGNRRRFDAFERSLAAGHLRVNSRPSPVLYDAVADEPKSLAVVNGTLGLVDPTYVSESDSFAAV